MDAVRVLGTYRKLLRAAARFPDPIERGNQLQGIKQSFIALRDIKGPQERSDFLQSNLEAIHC